MIQRYQAHSHSPKLHKGVGGIHVVLVVDARAHFLWHFDTPLQRIFLSEEMGAGVNHQYNMDAADTFMEFGGM